MDVRTHTEIDPELCGSPLELGEGFAEVGMTATERMAVDDRGLVHGGFVFGLADHAAMLAVNEPTVVLGRAETRFVRPVVVGDELVAGAEIIERSGNKRVVYIEVRRGDEVTMTGELVCYVLDRHVLDQR